MLYAWLHKWPGMRAFVFAGICSQIMRVPLQSVLAGSPFVIGVLVNARTVLVLHMVDSFVFIMRDVLIVA